MLHTCAHAPPKSWRASRGQTENWIPLVSQSEFQVDPALLQQRNTKKLHGIKNNCLLAAVRAHSVPKIQKRPKTPLPLLKNLEQRPDPACAQACNSHKGWANHLSHPSGPTLEPTPTFTLHKEQAHCPPPQGLSKLGKLLFVLHPTRPSISRMYQGTQ